jgi:hypothetical protein
MARYSPWSVMDFALPANAGPISRYTDQVTGHDNLHVTGRTLGSSRYCEINILCRRVLLDLYDTYEYGELFVHDSQVAAVMD